jgi:pyruvate/2-oxoglutarate dehydrogenase complex dihydrolipoamide acyltransferase (E2) component
MIPVLALSLAAGQALAQAPAAPTPAAPTPAAPTPAAPAAAAPAAAAPTTPRRAAFTRRFEAANTTHDGHLTKAQAHAAHLTATVRHFNAIDKDHKGFVTLDDLRTYAAAQRAQRKAAAKPPG